MKRLPKKSLDCRRGRPVDQRPSFHEFTTCWYLIWISKKYRLETRKFLTRFLEAWIHGKSSCRNLSIQCREKTETDGIFLVTQDQDIVAQVRMSEMALNRLSDVDLTSFPWNELTDWESWKTNSRIKDVLLTLLHEMNHTLLIAFV